jgi:hypothetical protein
MARRLELADGAWAEVREPPEMKVRHRRTIQAAALAAAGAIAKLPADMPKDPAEAAKLDMGSLGLDFAESDALLALQDATIVALLSAWSYPEPLPTMATVGDMETDVYDALMAATAATGAAVAAGASVDFDPDPAESSPTRPSTA